MREIYREIVRTVAMIALVPACGFVASGRSKCTPLDGIPDEPPTLPCYLNRYQVDSNVWITWPTNTLKGQFFVVVTSFVLFWMCVVALSFRAFPVSKKTEMGLVAVCSVLCFICAVLETWYTTGFGELGKYLNAKNPDDEYVQSWAAAAFFYYAITIMFALDILITYNMYKEGIEDHISTYSPSTQVSRQVSAQDIMTASVETKTEPV